MKIVPLGTRDSEKKALPGSNAADKGGPSVRASRLRVLCDEDVIGGKNQSRRTELITGRETFAAAGAGQEMPKELMD